MHLMTLVYIRLHMDIYDYMSFCLDICLYFILNAL